VPKDYDYAEMSLDPNQPTNPPVVPTVAPWADQLAGQVPQAPAPPLPLSPTEPVPLAAPVPVAAPLEPAPPLSQAPPLPMPAAAAARPPSRAASTPRPIPSRPIAPPRAVLRPELEPEPAPLPEVAQDDGAQGETDAEIVDQAGEDESFENDGMPLLPRGGAIFEDIPARAVVLAELAPALENGALVIRRPNGVGIVLVRDSELYERFCFHDSRDPLYGDAAMDEIRLWLDATVSAFRLKHDVVDMTPALLRGNPLYEDLRLSWTDWPSFIEDLRDRDGTYVVELRTPKGRGVTCIVNGKQVATFTAEHPEFGDPSLLDKLAASKRGTISVRCEPVDEIEFTNSEPEMAKPVASVQPLTAPAQPMAAADAAPPAAPGTINPFANGDAGNGNGSGVDNPFGPIFGSNGNGMVADHQPVNVSVAEVLPELKTIAQDRLQRSSSRVEAMLDDAAAADKPLESVLAEIRGLVIRGVMQSTLDSVVDEMLTAASSHAAA
jgi:hypothetical protein